MALPQACQPCVLVQALIVAVPGLCWTVSLTGASKQFVHGCRCRQELAAIDLQQKRFISLGEVTGNAVCSADVGSLLP